MISAIVRADFVVEPAAGIQAARFAGSASPLAEAPIEEGFVQARQVPDLRMAQRVQLLLRTLPTPGP